ncbi:hypothetical protein CCP3SC1AL1_990002 [Gammaproteobacteria bacterium]
MDSIELVLYNDAKKLILNSKLDEAIMFKMIVQMMILADKYKNLTGETKKNIVITVFQKIVEEESSKLHDENLKLIIRLMSTSIIYNMVDVIVDASNNKLDINKKNPFHKVGVFFKTNFGCCCK